jgi:hypothetical protein
MMLDAAPMPNFDDPLSLEVECSDTLAFEPVAHPDANYAEFVAFHGIESQRLVLIGPHAHARHPVRTAEALAQVADVLSADGWQVAIVGDSPDAGRMSAMLGAMQAGALYLAGTTKPETLAA